MPYSIISNKTKLRLIEAHQRDDDYRDLEWLLNVKLSTAYSIIRRDSADGKVECLRMSRVIKWMSK
jgi:hypothetical protein